MIAIVKPFAEGTSARPCGIGPCRRDCGRTDCEYSPPAIMYRIERHDVPLVQMRGNPQPSWKQFDKRRWAR